MNASRLLFEGLEDRILLNGASAALLGAVIHEESYAHVEIFVMADNDIGFTLPKFDDQGGTRTLLSVRLESTTIVTNGALQVENISGFGGTLTEQTLALTAESYVFTTPPFPAVPRANPLIPFVPAPAFSFTPPALTNSQLGQAMGPSGVVDWAAQGDPPDFIQIDVIGETTGLQQLTVATGDPQLNDFIEAAGDTVILFVAASETSVTVTSSGFLFNSRMQPAIQYTVIGSVVYQWTEDIPPEYTDETFFGTRRVFEKLPPPRFQPFYSGTAQPGASLTVDVLGLGGELLGSTSTVVDAGGNWAASFYDLSMTGEPHTVSIRQSYTGYTPLTGAGYNLRRYFSPAILGGAYASEQLTVENVLGNRSARVSMAALYSASAHPLSLGMAPYGFEMLPVSASPQGLY